MKEQYQIITQAFVARRVMSDADLGNLVQQINQACPGLSDEEARIDNLITTINENLRTLSLEIRKAIAETDAVLYWGLVNMRLDPHIQAATTFGAGELALFKKLIDMIVEEPAGHVALTDALLAAKDVNPPLTATRAQALVAQLCREKWLFDLNERRGGNNNNNNSKSKEDKKLTLGIRTMLELRGYFEEAYPEELKDCILCSEPVVLRQEKGAQCSNPPCSARMHIYCKDKWFHGKKDRRCPTCTTPWPSD